MRNKVLFILILVLGIILRVYKLYDVPKGIHIDEAGMFVDAISLAETGMDRHGTFYPIYLENFGQGQSIMYAYLVIPLVKLFGNSIYLVRIPSLVFGILSIIVSYLIAKEFYDDKKSLLLMFLVSTCPYFIQSSRIGLDCNLLYSFMMLGIYLYIKALRSRKKYLFILTGIVFGLSLYTYALSYIVVPLFLGITLLYFLKNRNISISEAFLLCVPLFIVIIPLVLFILVNLGIFDEFSLGFFSINRISVFRSSEFGIGNILDNLFSIVGLLSYDFYDYNALKFFGTIYYTLIPFFIYGFFVLIRKRDNLLDKMMLILFICSYIYILFIQDININKSNYIYFSIIYITFIGLINTSMVKVKSFVVLLNIILFTVIYYNNNKLDKFYFEDELYVIAKEEYNELKGKRVKVISDNNQPAIYLELGTKLVNGDDKIKVKDDNYDVIIAYKCENCFHKMDKIREFNRYDIYLRKK